MDKFDYNTGQALNGQAQSQFNMNTGQKIGETQNPTPIKPLVNTPSAIPVTSLTPQGSVVVPPTTQNTTPIYNEIANKVDTQLATDVAQAKSEAEAVQKAAGGEADKARKTLMDEVKALYTQRGEAIQSQAATEEQMGLAKQREALNLVNTEIADTNIRLRVEEDRLRATGMSEAQLAVERGNLQDTFGRRLADLGIRQSAANMNIAGIREDADRKTKLLLAPIENSIEFFSTFGKDNVDYLTQQEQQKLSLIQSNLEAKKQSVKELQKTKTDLLMEIAQNGGGTDQNLISQINSASSIEDAVSLAAKSGYVGALDRQLKQAQIQKAIADATATRSVNATPQEKAAALGQLANQYTQLADPVANKAVLAEIFAGDTVSAGTKGRIAPANNALNAIAEFSSNRVDGQFAGIGPSFQNFKALFGREDPASIQNKQNLAALDLKVQQWASGASLTEQQTKQVQKLVPKIDDTDRNVRTKLNGLYNYMINQVESDLLTDGVNINFKPVNLFETYDLYQNASPAQKAELKAQGYTQ